MNKVEKLLEKCEEEVKKPWFNWRFLLYCLIDEFKPQEIRKIFSDFEDLEEDEMKTFTKICDKRIDRIKFFSKDLVIGISVSAASLGIIASILIESKVIPEAEISPVVQWFLSGHGWLGMRIAMGVLFILIVLLALLIAHYWAQAHAWYAIKEGALMRHAESESEKEKSKAEGNDSHRESD